MNRSEIRAHYGKRPHRGDPGCEVDYVERMWGFSEGFWKTSFKLGNLHKLFYIFKFL